ncbi:MAG: phage tail protein [Bryobacterales bacterium]|nr:phage tail protein [Bryobacterales bacterium]
MDPFIGQLMCVGFSYAPTGWAICQGQLLPIAQNEALFSLLGNTYGGDGQTTFGLPDLRGRMPVGMGAAPGLSAYNLGQAAGAETVTLTAANLPAHTHPLLATSADQNDATPANSYYAAGGAFQTAANATMNAQMMAGVGGSQPHENRQPVLGINWIIALEGIYPTRS